MNYSEIQNKVIDHLDKYYNITAIEDFDFEHNGVLEKVVEVTLFDGEKYFRYNIWPDGETEIFTFAQESKWVSMYDPRFSMFRAKEEYGDESFDVVVEREMKKEEKEMSRVDLDSIANDAMLEAFENYVRDHQDELRRYAEETAREKVLDYVGNCLDLEDGAHSVIDDLINYHLEYDAQPDVQAQEDIINQYIFE